MVKCERCGKEDNRIVMNHMIGTSGTSLVGYVPKNVTYYDLIDIFGEPSSWGSGDNKVDVEWVGKIDGEVFTIYNYKTGPAYNDGGGTPIEEHTGRMWHIGGKSEEVAKKIIEHIEQHKKH